VNNNTDPTEPPKKSFGDHLLTGAKIAATVSAPTLSQMTGIPGISEAFESLFSVITPPLERRRAEWMISVYKKLIELEERIDGFSFKTLSEKPFFVDAFMQAFQIAMRNHHEEKLEALRNAVVNTAKPTFPEESLYLTFLNLVDILTPSHLKVLLIVHERELGIKDQRLDTRMMAVSLLQKVLSDYQELRGDHSFAKLIIRELTDRDLILSTNSPDIYFKDGNTYESYTTEFGKKFVHFISE